MELSAHSSCFFFATAGDMDSLPVLHGKAQFPASSLKTSRLAYLPLRLKNITWDLFFSRYLVPTRLNFRLRLADCLSTAKLRLSLSVFFSRSLSPVAPHLLFVLASSLVLHGNGPFSPVPAPQTVAITIYSFGIFFLVSLLLPHLS